MQVTDIPATPQYLTVGELACMLRVRQVTLYRAVQAHRLPAVRVGEVGPIRLPVAELSRALIPRGPALAPGTGVEGSPLIGPAVEARARAGSRGGGERST